MGGQQPAFEELFEPVLEVLSRPCEIWKNRDYKWKRAILKIIFAERLRYCRKTGVRTAKTTFPYNTLVAPKGKEDNLAEGMGLKDNLLQSKALKSLHPQCRTGVLQEAL